MNRYSLDIPAAQTDLIKASLYRHDHENNIGIKAAPLHAAQVQSSAATPRKDMSGHSENNYCFDVISTHPLVRIEKSNALSSDVFEEFKRCYVDVFSSAPYNFEMSLEHTEDTLKSVLGDQEHLTVLLRLEEDTDKVAGFAIGKIHSLDDKNMFFLDNLGVSPKLQGQGLGGKIMSCLFDSLPNSIAGVYLTTSENNSNARKFYTKHGFSTLELPCATINLEKSVGQSRYTVDNKVFYFRPHQSGGFSSTDWKDTLNGKGYVHNLSLLKLSAENLTVSLLFGEVVEPAVLSSRAGLTVRLFEYTEIATKETTIKRGWNVDHVCQISTAINPDSVCAIYVTPDLPHSVYPTLAKAALSAEVDLPHTFSGYIDFIDVDDQSKLSKKQVTVDNNQVSISGISSQHAHGISNYSLLYKGSALLGSSSALAQSKNDASQGVGS